MLQDFAAQLVDRKELVSGVLWFRFELNEPKTIDFTAGQYVIVKIPQLKVEDVARLYSICSPDFKKRQIELLLHLIPHGAASIYFAHLELGDRLNFQAPAGVFTLRNNAKDKIFLATGTGIAPIRSQLVSFLHRQSYTALTDMKLPSLHLLWGLRRREEVYFSNELGELKRKHNNFSFNICFSQETDIKGLDPSCFRVGRITSHLDGYVDPNVFDYYICGAPQIVTSVSAHLTQRGVSSENIFCEKF